MLIEGIDESLAEVVRESIGEGSLFEVREGYHADALRPMVAETFPLGWEERLVPLPGCEAVGCLEPHDLAAVKVQAGRPKDLELCAVLVATARLDPELIQGRLRETRMSDRLRVLASQRLKQVIETAEKSDGEERQRGDLPVQGSGAAGG